MVEYYGLNGPAPFSVIVWQKGGADVSKTVCYSKQDELEAISRFYAPGDLYNTYDKAIITRKNGQFEIQAKQKEVV